MRPVNRVGLMGSRFRGLGLAVAVSALGAICWTGSAWAQEPGGPDWVRPPSDLPAVAHDDPTYNLDTLFSALKIAPDEASAKAIETRIWAVWQVSGSDTCDLLMERAKAAIQAKD